MEQKGVKLDCGAFCCSVCLDVMKDPVNIPCGHSYCISCIKSFWDEEDQKKIHSCPQCRQTFTPRPVLVTVSAAAERTERQRELQLSRQQIQQRIQDREKDVKVLRQEVEAINGSADKAVEDSEKIFTELIRLMEKRSSDVKQQIRSQQKTEVSRVKELPAVSQLRDKLQDILRDTWTNISLTVTEVDVSLSQPEPRTRAGFLKYSQEITLDPNTANTNLLLSEGNRKATLIKKEESYSSHPDRFIRWCQVLSRESLTGRCYWEVEWRGEGVDVAVAYKSISRTRSSSESGFGHNDKSWALNCNQNGYRFFYNKIKTPVSGPQSSRVGVYLDHRAGVLSFYSVSETMTLLHRVQTTFTQPLYAGLWLPWYNGDTAELCKLK
ncbi:tripartite motif-containing protein 16-like protein [Seriola lalandi dorsalis]|uniref:tripartite motif-containing protein 16-like protein n=1 Tax=Seriola lalandi dorsalis TaxID=1841481 RepID=UPI000C6FADEE|nr:tripartite motif-containing protein 16-like protein [Seriola lalandi dorsalis]